MTWLIRKTSQATSLMCFHFLNLQETDITFNFKCFRFNKISMKIIDERLLRQIGKTSNSTSEKRMVASIVHAEHLDLRKLLESTDCCCVSSGYFNFYFLFDKLTKF